MTNPIPRLLDALLPWRVEIRKLTAACLLWEETDAMRKIEIAHLTRERDAARRQFAETKTVNLHNAAAHRASEVAALMSNVAQNAEIERLRVALPGAKPRAIESVEMPAIRVPKLRPLDMAEKIPAQLSAVPQPETKSP